MTLKTITAEDARRYAIKAEDHVYDKKSADASGKTVQKIGVALANADGGEFVVGISDEGEQPDPEKRWNGRDSVEAFNPILQALFEVTPTLPMEPLFLQSTGHPGYVLLVRIEKSSVVHHTTDNTVYVRVGAQSLPVKDLKIL